MPRKRKRSSTPASGPDLDSDTLRKLSECGTRVGLTQAMHHLSEAGWLRPSVANKVTAGARSKLTAAVADHANAITPYGNVLQYMDLAHAQQRHWAYVHP